MAEVTTFITVEEATGEIISIQQSIGGIPQIADKGFRFEAVKAGLYRDLFKHGPSAYRLDKSGAEAVVARSVKQEPPERGPPGKEETVKGGRV